MQQLPIIQTLWIGEKLSTLEQLCISSFLAHGHPFHLYTYGNVLNIPDNVVIKDANEIIPADKIFTYKENGSYAGFADLFRYKLLLEKGNYWVDADVVCMQPLDEMEEYVFVSERMENGSTHITNCVIKAPAGSAVMEYCYAEAVKKDVDTLKWGDAGPKLIQEAVDRFGLKDFVVDPERFCPIDWWDWRRLIDPSIDQDVIANSKAVHFWNEMWRRSKIDKSGQFEKNSLYEIFKRKYLDAHG